MVEKVVSPIITMPMEASVAAVVPMATPVVLVVVADTQAVQEETTVPMAMLVVVVLSILAKTKSIPLE